MTLTTQEHSFFMPFFFPAPHSFTDGVKLCSTNCLNIIFGGFVVVWGEGVCKSHTAAEKENNLRNVFDTVINYIYHTILPEKKKHLP